MFRTDGDHRLAMSMAVLATYLNLYCKGQAVFVVDSKNAVNKTFPGFWKYLKDIGLGFTYSYGNPNLVTFKNPSLVIKPS